jgi:hypothetical protein
MQILRAIAPCGNTVHRTIALCFFAAAFTLFGCRGTNSPDEPAAGFVLAAGDRLVYDGWTTNVWGYTLDSSKTRRTWDVLTTTSSGGGYNDAVMIREEILRLTSNTTTVDTFLLRLTPEGNVLRYGFLADLVKRREARVIPPRWDTLAVPDARFWMVGVMDSAGQMNVSASVNAKEDYFNVEVNGVSSIFAARLVEMESESLQYAFWFSTNPPCFPRFEEAPDPVNGIPNGSLLLLRQLRLAPR